VESGIYGIDLENGIWNGQNREFMEFLEWNFPNYGILL
jgi:hypothetical protein